MAGPQDSPEEFTSVESLKRLLADIWLVRWVVKGWVRKSKKMDPVKVSARHLAGGLGSGCRW